jgi:hypothetical protein
VPILGYSLVIIRLLHANQGKVTTWNCHDQSGSTNQTIEKPETQESTSCLTYLQELHDHTEEQQQHVVATLTQNILQRLKDFATNGDQGGPPYIILCM